MGNKAYIAGNLDCAVLLEDGRATLVPGKNNIAPEQIDGYRLSQIFAANPEIIGVDYSSVADLQSQTEVEYEKQEVLSMALELMDDTLSEDYRKEIAVLLSTELDTKPGLFTFIQNRFLATPLPEGFDPFEAKEIADGVSNHLATLYETLEEKAKLFAAFYTQLVLRLNLEPVEQELLDLKLTDNGCYAGFTTALYENSQKKYDRAVEIAIPVLEQLNTFESEEMFNKIQESLTAIFNLNFARDIFTLPKLINQTNFKNVFPIENRRNFNVTYMRDQYNMHGQVGTAGPKARAADNTFNNIDDGLPVHIDFEALTQEFAVLKQTLLTNASTPEHFAAIGEVAAAEGASKSKDGVKVMIHLAASGKWVADVAKNLYSNGISALLFNRITKI